MNQTADPAGAEQLDRRFGTLPATLLTDTRLLASATSLRFGVLVLMLVASTGSIYSAIGLLLTPGLDTNASRCTSNVSSNSARMGLLASGHSAIGAVQCEIPYTGRIVTWTLVGIGVILLSTVVVYRLTPLWITRWTRPWLPFGRDEKRRLRARRPWWLPGPPQRLKMLDESLQDQRRVAKRIRELSTLAGLPEVPRCVLNPYAHDTGALAFEYRGHGYLRLNGGLRHLLFRDPALRDPAAFDGIILHELGHLANRDNRPTYLTYASWRAFAAFALTPFLVALIFPNLISGPLGPHMFSPRRPPVSGHMLASVLVLTVLTFLTRNAVLRSRETHADVRAGLVDAESMRAAIRHYEARRRLRKLSVPAALALHPSPVRRMRNLDESDALCKPESLGMVAAGIASGLAVANVQWITWFVALSSSWPSRTLVPHLMGSVLKGRFWPILELLLIMDGPTVLLGSVLFAGFAGTVMWRAALGAAAGGGRVRVLRHALPWTIGFLLGEPMSIIYAMSDSWGVLDRSAAREAADVAASALILLLVAALTFQWAAEGAAAWISKTAGSLRRRQLQAITVGALGTCPVFFPWLLFHGTQAITQTVYFVPDRQTSALPLSGFMLTSYAPIGYANALPGSLLLIAMTTLFVFTGSMSRPLDRPPKWLPGNLAPGSWERLRGPVPTPRARSSLKPGILGALVSVVLGLGFMLTFRAAVGPAKMSGGFGPTGEMYMFNTMIALTAIACAGVAVTATRRDRRTPVSSVLMVVFSATVLASPFLTGAVFAGACGGRAWTCFAGNPQRGMAIYGRIATGAPLYGAIAAVLLWWALSLIRKLRPPVVVEAADLELTVSDSRFTRTATLVIVLIGLAFTSYVTTRYITFGKVDLVIDNLIDVS